MEKVGLATLIQEAIPGFGQNRIGEKPPLERRRAS